MTYEINLQNTLMNCRRVGGVFLTFFHIVILRTYAQKPIHFIFNKNKKLNNSEEGGDLLPLDHPQKQCRAVASSILFYGECLFLNHYIWLVLNLKQHFYK